MEIRQLTFDDEDLLCGCAPDIFDNAVAPLRAAEFLNDDRHHLIAAIAAGRIVGFLSAVHYVHPDKAAAELWINEVGVAAAWRRQGIALRLLTEVQRLAARLHCGEVWVLTERDNVPAMSLYASVPKARQDDTVMFTLPPLQK
ncbi:MAG: GNAT family N-acetyltransferase [Planctomycetaceae bacterium]|nr:GNAT family N-acetyltransferase [Planctomycetaceae bacterium]